jgi:hypothetical protein
MTFQTRARVRALTFVSLLSVSLIALALGDAARGTTASRSLIAIHEKGTDNINVQGPNGATRGKFTIELQKTPFGPAGTTIIYPIPTSTRSVNGQEQIPFVATDHLTSKAGTIELKIKGVHVDVNSKLSSSGHVVGPSVEQGTWKIGTATGMYQGWRGGGNFASVIDSYRSVRPYDVEFDGYITH